MKKIAFTLYMTSLTIMFPLYIILELTRSSDAVLNPGSLSMGNQKVQMPNSQTVNFSRSELFKI